MKLAVENESKDIFENAGKEHNPTIVSTVPSVIFHRYA
jgi:hypothetical protein